MAEAGCLRDGAFQNVAVSGTADVAKLVYKRPVVALSDAGAAQAIRATIAASESGTIFTVPALTTGTQTIALPTTLEVGLTYTFVTTATTGQIFNVQGGGTNKILAVLPKGDGDNTAASQGYDTVGFTASAILGSAFTCTCISTTAATAWLVSNVVDGLEANTGSLVVA